MEKSAQRLSLRAVAQVQVLRLTRKRGATEAQGESFTDLVQTQVSVNDRHELFQDLKPLGAA